MNFLSDIPELSIYNCLISADNVGGLVCILDWEGVLKGSGGDLMLSYKGPVYTVDLGSRVNDCGGVDIFHGERGDDEFHFYVQRVLLSRSTMNSSGESLCQNSSPFQKSRLYFSWVESCPMTRSLSSSAISSIAVVVSTTATFLVGGQAGERVGRGGRFVKVVQDAAMCPFCWH